MRTREQLFEIMARRLGVKVSRVGTCWARLALLNRVTPVKGGRRTPDPPSCQEATWLFCALIGTQHGRAQLSAKWFADLLDPSRTRLFDVLEDLLFGPVDRHVRFLIAKRDDPSVTIVIDGHHRVFGETTQGATEALLLPGRTVIALRHELRGAKPAVADEMARLAA